MQTDAYLADDIALWPGWMPSGLVNLGLDLRGGAHLLAEVQVADVYQARVEGMWPEVRDLLREERATIGPIRLQPTEAPELRVRLVEKPENRLKRLPHWCVVWRVRLPR